MRRCTKQKTQVLTCVFCFCTSLGAERAGFARAGSARDAQPRGPLQGFRLIPCPPLRVFIYVCLSENHIRRRSLHPSTRNVADVGSCSERSAELCAKGASPLKVHHNRGIRTPRRERNRFIGFFFFCSVFVRVPVFVGIIGKNQV